MIPFVRAEGSLPLGEAEADQLSTQGEEIEVDPPVEEKKYYKG